MNTDTPNTDTPESKGKTERESEAGSPRSRPSRQLIKSTAVVAFLLLSIIPIYLFIKVGRQEARLQDSSQSSSASFTSEGKRNGNEAKETNNGNGPQGRVEQSSTQASGETNGPPGQRRSSEKTSEAKPPSDAEIAVQVQRELAEERARRSAARNRAISEVREEVRKAEEEGVRKNEGNVAETP